MLTLVFFDRCSYQHIFPSLLQVYSHHQSNEMVTTAIEVSDDFITVSVNQFKGAQSRYFALFWPHTKLPLNCRKPENNSLIR